MSLYILILGEVTDAFVLGKNYLSGICMDLFHYNAKKCGLAGTVITDQSSFFAFFYMKRGIFQNHFFTEGFGDTLT